jgi:hypothetical protein
VNTQAEAFAWVVGSVLRRRRRRMPLISIWVTSETVRFHRVCFEIWEHECQALA